MVFCVVKPCWTSAGITQTSRLQSDVPVILSSMRRYYGDIRLPFLTPPAHSSADAAVHNVHPLLSHWRDVLTLNTLFTFPRSREFIINPSRGIGLNYCILIPFRCRVATPPCWGCPRHFRGGTVLVPHVRGGGHLDYTKTCITSPRLYFGSFFCMFMGKAPPCWCP